MENFTKKTLYNTDSEDASTDKGKRKRGDQPQTEAAKKSRKLVKTPTKHKKEESNDFKEIKEMLLLVMGELKEMHKEQKEHIEVINSLKEENNNMKIEIKQLNTRVRDLEGIENKMEQLERSNKRNNVVISGLTPNEIESGAAIQNFVKEYLKIDIHIESMYKIRADMCSAKLASKEEKEKLMKAKTQLRFVKERKVYISNDLTWKERKIQKLIRERAVKEKQLNKEVKIGYQRLYIGGKKWTWNKVDNRIEKDVQHELLKN